MSFELTRSISMPAGGAVAQGRFLTVNTSGQVVQAAAAADAVLVSAEAAAAAGDVINCYELNGKFEVEASAAISIGDNIGVAANGMARTATTGDGVLGIALEAAGAANVFITMLAAPAPKDSA